MIWLEMAINSVWIDRVKLRKVVMSKWLILSWFFFLGLGTESGFSQVTSLLAPVKTESPKETMHSFMKSMEAYRIAKKAGNAHEAREAIDRARRTFNYGDTPTVGRYDLGNRGAVYLKEVLDRVIVVDYKRIPPSKDEPDLPVVWRLKGTEIAIGRVQQEGSSAKYLFTHSTLLRARDFFETVRHLPYLKGTGQGAGYSEPIIQRVLPKIMRQGFAGLDLWQWFGLFILGSMGFLIRKLASGLITIFKRFTSWSKLDWDDRILNAIDQQLAIALMALFWLVSINLLGIEGNIYLLLKFTIKAIINFCIVWMAYSISAIFSEYLQRKAQKSEFKIDNQLAPMLGKTVRILTLIFGTLMALQNLDYNVMSVVAGLGLGGLAFALAAKDTAANIFGSIMILSDRPFKVGDWVKFAGVEGVIEEVGFRSTKVRTFYNSIICIPNSVVANENIDNYGRRQWRRVKSNLGITYDTPPEKIEAFLEGIKNVIKANQKSRKDYYHVVFEGFGPSALDIMLYFFLKVDDWSEELVERQNIYLEILRLASDLGIDFAFPTQSLHVESFPGKDKVIRHNEQWSPSALKEEAKLFGPEGKSSKPKGLGIFVPPHLEKS
ncbi:MAG: hypothetical protein CMP10_06825 [Zetaproteobacteria bacterium]|nr:hypothetical protein [Pseudobdellovibrionaceae bacterium]